jgi:hypothetical protein
MPSLMARPEVAPSAQTSTRALKVASIFFSSGPTETVHRPFDLSNSAACTNDSQRISAPPSPHLVAMAASKSVRFTAIAAGMSLPSSSKERPTNDRPDGDTKPPASAYRADTETQHDDESECNARDDTRGDGGVCVRTIFALLRLMRSL